MVQYCAAIGCTNKKTPGNKLRFFRFPFKDRERLDQWTRATKRKDWAPSKYSTLCADHFQTGQPQPAKDHPDYIPNVFAHMKGKLKGNAELWQKRKDRLRVREEKKIQDYIGKIIGCAQPTSVMEFVGFSEPAGTATVCKQEVDTGMDFAPTEPTVRVDTFSMDYMDSPVDTVVKNEEDIHSEEADQDDTTKAIKSDVELRKANKRLATYNLKLHNTIDALVENNVELQNSNESLKATRNELRNTNAALVQINIELQNSNTELHIQKQQLHRQIQDLTVKMQTVDRRGVVIRCLMENNDRLSKTNEELERKLEASEDLLNRSICSANFLQDDARCVFYTGLPNQEMFGKVLQETLKILPGTPERISSLTPDQRLLIVLMKLKLNYYHEDIANRFHISTANVCRIMKTWLPYVAQVLGSRIEWLSRDDLKQSLPDCFKCPAFEDAVCMFHCFELDTQKCKNHPAVPTLGGANTFTKIKFLVGVAPHGAIMFVSEGLGGKVSDDDVAVHSGILDKLQENDVVLVDYEYLGHEEFTKKGIRLVIPSLRKQNDSKAELIYNSDVTHVLRNHIQRVIGRLRKFKALSEVLSYYDVVQVGHIVKACAGIVNMRVPVVHE